MYTLSTAELKVEIFTCLSNRTSNYSCDPGSYMVALVLAFGAFLGP